MKFVFSGVHFYGPPQRKHGTPKALMSGPLGAPRALSISALGVPWGLLGGP
jgi:hypothetical protein